MTDFIIPIVWPIHPINDGSTGMRWPLLGHAGAIVVDGGSGAARYYDYGRYDPAGQGMVRDPVVGSLSIVNGEITQASLTAYLDLLQDRGRFVMMGSVFSAEDGAYERGIEFAERARNDEVGVLGAYSWALNNHCYSFVKRIADEMGMSLDWFDGLVDIFDTPSLSLGNVLENAGGFTYAPSVGESSFRIVHQFFQSQYISQAIAPCFSASTPILLADGTNIAIEDIRVGLRVAAFDERDAAGTAKLTSGLVTRLIPGITSEWIVLDDTSSARLGQPTRVTPGHRYLRQPSDACFPHDGTFMAIVEPRGASFGPGLLGTRARDRASASERVSRPPNQDAGAIDAASNENAGAFQMRVAGAGGV